MGLKGFLKKLSSGFKRVFRGRKKASKKPRKKRLLDQQEQTLLPVAPEPPVQSLPTVKAVVAIEEFSSVQLSVHTQRAYRKDLQDFFSFLKLQGLWENWNENVGPTHVAQYRSYLLKQRGLAKGSVTRKLAVLKSFYRWSIARGWLKSNPAELVRSFPQTQESKTGYLADTEISRLLGHFQAVPKLGLHAALCKTVTETLLMLGLRRGEASKLTVGALEFLDSRWLLRIRGKGERDRVLPLPSKLIVTWSHWLRRICDDAPMQDLNKVPAEWVDWVRRNHSSPVLISTRMLKAGTPLSGSEIGRIIRKTARKAGLVNRVSPHMLRATAITHALDQGASHRGVQQMAGWTSPLMITRYDKRRKDPRFSAIFHLKYAQVVDPSASVRPSPGTEATEKMTERLEV